MAPFQAPKDEKSANPPCAARMSDLHHRRARFRQNPLADLADFSARFGVGLEQPICESGVRQPARRGEHPQAPLRQQRLNQLQAADGDAPPLAVACIN